MRAEADLTSYPEQVEGEQTQAFAACLNALTGRSAEHWRKQSAEPIGPVHLNICFDTPLTPLAVCADAAAVGAEPARRLRPAG